MPVPDDHDLFAALNAVKEQTEVHLGVLQSHGEVTTGIRPEMPWRIRIEVDVAIDPVASVARTLRGQLGELVGVIDVVPHGGFLSLDGCLVHGCLRHEAPVRILAESDGTPMAARTPPSRVLLAIAQVTPGRNLWPTVRIARQQPRQVAMTLLANYGHEIAATTLALQQLLAPAAPLVTTRTVNAARTGVSGASVNLALYRDQLITYRSGNDPDPRGQLLAELHYLVSVHVADDADTDAASQLAFGAARAAIEETAILTVPIPGASDGDANRTMHVRLQGSSLPLLELTSLWLSSQAPFALSFTFTASFALLRKRVAGPGPIGLGAVTSIARPGVIAVFSGADASGKAGAAASVAQELGGALVSATLEEVVSRHIGETEENLRRLYDRAEEGRSVLLLDEADALFGSRTGVSDAHGRYAGVEAGPVLELLERAPSLVIIAVGAVVGPELAERAAVEVRFPPDEP